MNPTPASRGAPEDPARFIRNIARGDDGVWRPMAQAQHAVSYPADGHDLCLGVEEGSFWFRHRNRCIASAVRSHPPPGGLPIADVGGGNGYVTRMLVDEGHRAILIEPGEAGIRNALARGLREVVQGSTDELDITPGSLGGIGLFDVLEHIPDDDRALRRLRDLLVEGGHVYVTVPAHAWLWSSIDVDAGHQRRYSLPGLRSLFERTGFTVAFGTYFFWPLPLPMFALRVTRERLFGKQPRNTRVRAEHRDSAGMLDALLSWERRRIERNLQVPLGASCLLVATKHSH